MPCQPEEDVMAITEDIFKLKFTPMDGGFLLETPSPWLLGPRRRYVVTEDQKATLTTSAQSKRAGLGYLLVMAGIAAICSGLLTLWSAVHLGAVRAELAALNQVLIVAIYASAVLLAHRQLRRIEAVVGAAVPSRDGRGRV
jgi:hypothetical protein